MFRTFTAWKAEVDRLAIRQPLIEPGASFTKRFRSDHWRDYFEADSEPEEALAGLDYTRSGRDG